MEITPFDFSGKTVRILTDDEGNPWWVAKDVCCVLGHPNTSQVVSALDKDEKMTLQNMDSQRKKGGAQYYIIINEPGLYRLLSRSNKKRAKKFQRWVFHDVLPEIRKTGSYSIKKLPQTYAEALRALADKSEAEEKLLIEKKKNEPKVEYYNDVRKAVNVHDLNRAAKILGLGRNTMMKKLREDKILMKNNLPYHRYIDAGYFRVKETTFKIQGVDHISSTTFVTGKGTQWLSRRFNGSVQLALFNNPNHQSEKREYCENH